MSKFFDYNVFYVKNNFRGDLIVCPKIFKTSENILGNIIRYSILIKVEVCSFAQTWPT